MNKNPIANTASPGFPSLDGGHYRMKMGMNRIPPSEWIDIDKEFVPQLSIKRALHIEHHDDVFQSLPGAEAAGHEALALLVQNLLQYHGAIFEQEGGKLRNKLTGEVWDLNHTTLLALDQAGRLVQEDFCILQSDDTHRYRLTAASVCFPGNWRLSDKIGRPLNLIHEPVPGYRDNLETLVDRSFERLLPNNLFWRANWVIHDNPELFRPEMEEALKSVTPENAGDRLWFRSERQTLQRLPESRAVLFTIRTRVMPLRLATATVINAGELASTIRTMPDTTLHYRRMTEIRSDLLAWLDQN